MLFEAPDEKAWWQGVDRYEKNGHPGYRDLVTWARGRCFKGYEKAKEAYDAAQKAGA